MYLHIYGLNSYNTNNNSNNSFIKFVEKLIALCTFSTTGNPLFYLARKLLFVGGHFTAVNFVLCVGLSLQNSESHFKEKMVCSINIHTYLC
jgi:hypothetical protein